MFGTLFAKECHQTAKSLIYWLLVVILTLFFFSQLGELEVTKKPVEGQQDYGVMYSRDEQVIMEMTLGNLAEEYYYGSYGTYPIGFYKSVTLNEEESRRVGNILKETSGITDMEVIEKKMEEHYNTGEEIVSGIAVEHVTGLTYPQFEKKMQEIDDILGGGSAYAKDMLASNAMVPMTYEDALKEYETLVNKEQLTGGYARLFCDYMGVLLCLLPVFLSVTRGLRDRRAGMQELIAVRKASALSIIGSRYLAMIVMVMIPVLILSCVPLAECIKYASGAGITVDYLAFVKYSLGWLLPSVMTAVSVGLVITVLTDTAAGVLVQGIWWFLAAFGGMSSMQEGTYGWSLMPRHNTVGNYDAFRENFTQLAANRLAYVLLSLVIVGVTVWIYSQKRKGKLDIHGKICANRKRKSKA